MKVNDSGLPEESYWNNLFNIPLIIEWLNLKSFSCPIVEMGCGYRTFTLPIARKTKDEVYAFDINPVMIEAAQRLVQEAGIRNVQFIQRDIVDEGTGLESNSVGLVLLFNILHFTNRRIILNEVSRILKPSGTIAFIHLRKDITKPLGPALHVRPDKQIILKSIIGLNLSFKGTNKILEPYHWGIKLTKGTSVGSHFS
jgi:ubiquinone/menaquinone biosynthesis C-methylase UbiE